MDQIKIAGRLAWRGSRVAALIALSLPVPTEAPAQRAESLEAGLLTSFEDAAFVMGYRATSVKQGRAGVDFTVATAPQAYADGFVNLFMHVDLTGSISVGSRSWLLPRAGLSVLAVAGEDNGAAPGFNVGIGLLGRSSERHGLRFDVTHMRLIGEDGGIGVTTFAVGYAWIK